MKTIRNFRFGLAGVVAALLCAAGSVQAQITGINAASSFMTNVFNDLSSLNGGNPGAYYFAGLSANPWNGAAVAVNLTDPTTLDNASASISASGGGNNYSVSVNNLTLTQPVGNTGHADLIYLFVVNYQLGGSGLPAQPTQFPTFLASGTVQPAGFASVSGYITLDGVDINGVATTLDTVNYNWTYNTPGPFSNISVTGTPVGGTTPALSANTVLRMYGQIVFKVDPATLTLVTVPPDPTIVSPTRLSDTEFGFSIYGTNGANYTVEYCTDLILADWTTLTSFQLTTNPFPVVDTNATNSACYYRVRKD